MGYVCVLILVITNTVLCYHFYNSATHQLLVGPSLDNIPAGYELIPPPRSHTRRRNKHTRGTTNGYCSDGGFTCSAPYDKSQTFQFECSVDDQCPANYKCCSQKCFLHKVCVKAVYSSNSSDIKKKSCNYKRPGHCDKWPYNCRVPYHYSMTYRFKCNQDSQCPRNFKCCQQNCFMHKICSKIVSSVTQPPVKMGSETDQTTEREETSETTTEATTEATTETTTETIPETTTSKILPEYLITARYYPPTYGVAEETISSTTTEATTVTEKDYDNEDSRTEYSLTEGVEETEISTEAEFKTTVVEIAVPEVTVASKRTTLDPNAIDPNYSEYYYENNSTEIDADEDDEDENYNNYPWLVGR